VTDQTTPKIQKDEKLESLVALPLIPIRKEVPAASKPELNAQIDDPQTSPTATEEPVEKASVKEEEQPKSKVTSWAQLASVGSGETKMIDLQLETKTSS
jgi:hypothetical protein